MTDTRGDEELSSVAGVECCMDDGEAVQTSLPMVSRSELIFDTRSDSRLERTMGTDRPLPAGPRPMSADGEEVVEAADVIAVGLGPVCNS